MLKLRKSFFFSQNNHPIFNIFCSIFTSHLCFDACESAVFSVISAADQKFLIDNIKNIYNLSGLLGYSQNLVHQVSDVMWLLHLHPVLMQVQQSKHFGSSDSFSSWNDCCTDVWSGSFSYLIWNINFQRSTVFTLQRRNPLKLPRICLHTWSLTSGPVILHPVFQ